MEKSGKNEFLGLLCNLYIVNLLVALPLYTGEGYWQLGNTKYVLFYNMSLLCLGGWLAAGMPGRIKSAVGYVRARGSGGSAAGYRGFSAVDGAMAAYGALAVVSALCSSYGRLAWVGYEGWFMGALSQLFFVGIYFFVSRQYDGAAWPLRLGEAAFFLVTALGLLHRLGIDPLGLMEGWNSGDWEYSHMLSTLGNINWLCGFYSVALAFPLVHFLGERKRWLQAVLYVVTVSAFVLLGIQGSQGGLLILAVCGGMCIYTGRRDEAALQKTFWLFAGFFVGMPLMGWLMELRGDKAAVVKDGNVFAVVPWYIWWLAAAACVALALVFRCIAAGKAGNPQVSSRRLATALLLGGGILALVLAVRLFAGGIDDSFGNGRGFLWRISLEGFREAGWKDKLLGVGPDCYGEAVFGRQNSWAAVWEGDHWEGAVFTNAHNEVLSQLCNMGVLGLVSYLALFLMGWCRYGTKGNDSGAGRLNGEGRGGGASREYGGMDLCLAGLFALAMYGAHGLISFQQVLGTPLLFLALGLSESRKRFTRN